MSEQMVSASEVREKFADYLDDVEQGRRVLVTRHGQGKAYLIGVRELRALEETLAVLGNKDLMRSIERGLVNLSKGEVEDARDVFAELDAEFASEE